MKKLLYLLALVIATSPFAKAQEINWLSWNEAMELRKTEPKKVFIDVYTDWCGWCKKMDASTFKDPAVVEYMNKNFYCIKLDAERTDTITFNGMTFVSTNPGQKRAVHTLAYSLLDGKMSYPSYVILDENMVRLNIIAGYKSVEPLMAQLLFFGTNTHVQYQQYLQAQEQLKQQQQAAMQQQGK